MLTVSHSSNSPDFLQEQTAESNKEKKNSTSQDRIEQQTKLVYTTRLKHNNLGIKMA